MYVRKFHPISTDEAIEVEHFSRPACSGKLIRDSPVDDTIGRAGVQNKFQAFQVTNSTFDLDQEATHKMERNCGGPCERRRCGILLRLNLTHEEEHACNKETRPQEFHHARLAPE